MARTHREANFKVSPRIRYHRKRAPGPVETTTIDSGSGKFNTFIHQGRGEHKWITPPAIWSNWKKYSDLTGQFPMQSDRGNNYILVAYHYDANNILTTPLKNRIRPCIQSGITKIHDKLRKRGYGRAQIMVQQNNSQLPWILHHQSQRNENAVSKKNWNIPLLCPLCGLYYATSPQHTSRETIKSN